MRNDLTLRPIIAKHLPELESYRAYLAGYGDEALALKFFDYFRDGQRKFASIRTHADYQELKEFAEISDKLTKKFYTLSRENKERLEATHSDIAKMIGFDSELTGTRETRRKLTELDYKLFWTGFCFDSPDEPDEGPMVLPRSDGFFQYLDQVSISTARAFEEIHNFAQNRRVNWSVCAVTYLAQMAWQKRTGNDAPQSAHADAPGPFGIFLEEILAELFQIYDIQTKSIPTARSALRALDTITNSGIDFLANW